MFSVGLRARESLGTPHRNLSVDHRNSEKLNNWHLNFLNLPLSYLARIFKNQELKSSLTHTHVLNLASLPIKRSASQTTSLHLANAVSSSQIEHKSFAIYSIIKPYIESNFCDFDKLNPPKKIHPLWSDSYTNIPNNESVSLNLISTKKDSASFNSALPNNYQKNRAVSDNCLMLGRAALYTFIQYLFAISIVIHYLCVANRYGKHLLVKIAAYSLNNPYFVYLFKYAVSKIPIKWLRPFILMIGSLYYLLGQQVWAFGTTWEAGRLDYVYGGAEVAAFVNTKEQIQLQLVLCSQNEPSSYRMSVLLPHDPKTSGIIPVKLMVDGTVTHVYAEIQGNALEFQVGTDFLITLPDSPSFDMEFSKEDAQYLKIPRRVSFSMDRIKNVLSEVARSCNILCDKNAFDCNLPLISGILWPVEGFNAQDRSVWSAGRISKVDEACLKFSKGSESPDYNSSDESISSHSKKTVSSSDINSEPFVVTNGLVSSIEPEVNMPYFSLSDKCRKVLDETYEKQGKDALSFLPNIFKNPTGNYAEYKSLWNSVVDDASIQGLKTPYTEISDYDYYLTLFALFSDTNIKQYPQSYYDIIKQNNDLASFIYAMDNRYELETVKYSSVLYRRFALSLSMRRNAENALSAWNQFYQEFSNALPPLPRAQALRPVIYRQMLMRVWRLSGYPDALHLQPKYTFVQGSHGKTITKEPLEAKCSTFEGSRGDQFFFASKDCVHFVKHDMRNLGLLTDEYRRLEDTWNAFATAWKKSIFYNKGSQDAVGEHMQSSFTLTMLSLYKTYGFGDYFLLRKCLSTRDTDICDYENEKNLESYNVDIRKTISAISEVSNQDAQTLRHLNELWNDYYDALKIYTTTLAQRGRIASWRASFVLGVATTIQSEAILNASYNKQGITSDIEDNYEDDF